MISLTALFKTFNDFGLSVILLFLFVFALGYSKIQYASVFNHRLCVISVWILQNLLQFQS